jgi:putative transposase
MEKKNYTEKNYTEKNYTSDLTVSQYNQIAGHLPHKKRTAPRKASYHAIVNAILYRLKNGCVWKDLPKDFPHYKTVFHYFTLWKKQGIWDTILDDLNTRNRTAQKKVCSHLADRGFSSGEEHGHRR